MRCTCKVVALPANQSKCSLRASSPFGGYREKCTRERPLALVRAFLREREQTRGASRAARFARPNRRACSQAQANAFWRTVAIIVALAPCKHWSTGFIIRIKLISPDSRQTSRLFISIPEKLNSRLFHDVPMLQSVWVTFNVTIEDYMLLREQWRLVLKELKDVACLVKFDNLC